MAGSGSMPIVRSGHPVTGVRDVSAVSVNLCKAHVVSIR